MVEWFGSTLYGPAAPIKYMIKQGFEEPSSNLSLEERMNKISAETIVLDCYIERADGYPYGSKDVLQRMRSKGLLKKIGPNDMYINPVLTSMDYGWFLADPDLQNSTWHRNATLFTKPKTEITKFLEFALALDKFFKF